MRILVIGNVGPGSAAWSTENDLANELRALGHAVDEMPEHNTTGHVEYKLVRQRADAAGVVLWISTPGRALPQLGAAVLESPTPAFGMHLDLYRGLRREQSALASAFFRLDYVFTADGGAPAGWWEERNVKHYWSPPGVLSSSCYLGEPDPEAYPFEIIFVGSTGYHGEHAWRGTMLDWLRKTYGSRFGVYDHGWTRTAGEHGINYKMRGANLNNLYSTAKVAIGDSCFAGRDGYHNYTSDRLFEAGGRGAIQVYPAIDGVTRSRALSLPLMREGRHLFRFDAGNLDDGPDSLKAAIEDALSMSDEDRLDMRKRSIEHVAAHHTYRHRLERCFAIMGLEGES